MFRRRSSAAASNAAASLPTTGSGTSSGGRGSSFRSSLLASIRGTNKDDGSARTIRLKHKSFREMWDDASAPVRATYVCLLAFLLCFWWGVRSIRYRNSHVHLDCQSLDCRLTILPAGWHRKVVAEFPRRQLLQAFAVKTDVDGNFVEANPKLDDDVVYAPHKGRKTGKYKPKNAGHYKGPDKNGHYYSYAVVLQDKVPEQQQRRHEHREGEPTNDLPAEETVKFGSDFDPYLVDLGDGGKKRLIVRQFQIGQSKRRVRMMVSRIDGYIKQRRQRLIVKEQAVPSWQGILMIVLGLVGFLITLLVGQFWDEHLPGSAGPGVRRHSQQQQQQRRSVEQRRSSAYDRTTPSRYEVRTKPAAQPQPIQRRTAPGPPKR